MAKFSHSAVLFLVLLIVTFVIPANAASLTEETETPTELPTVWAPTVAETTELPTISAPTTEPATVAQTPTPTENPVGGGGIGYIWVYSNVDGASVSFSPGSYSCTTSGGFCSVQVYTTGTPATSFTVSKDGYQTYYGTVSQWPSDGATVYYTATLNPVVPTTIPTTVIGEGTGYIWVYCNVDGALVSFSPGSSSCTVSGGFCSVRVSTMGTPFTSYTVTKSGYNTGYGSVNLWPSDGETVYYTTILDPVTPTTGTLYVTTSPSSASVYLNGNFQGYSPTTITNLAPGTYTLSAQRSGYSTATQSATVYSGQISTASLTLSPSPSPSTGTLYVTSSPTSALVYIDGLYSGLTPLTTTLSTGTHSVLVQKSGYSYWSGTATLSANSQQTMQATLTPAANGWITILSSPAGATIYLDNTYKGQTGTNGALTINSVYPGLHVLKAVAPGYTSYTTTMDVDANARTYVPIKMTLQQGNSPTPSPGYSGLEISSVPDGASVYLDNVSMGVTPLTLTSVSAGQHTLLVQKSGYQDERLLIQTTQGTILPLELALIPGTTPTATTKSPEVPFVALGALGILGVFLHYTRKP